MACKLPTLGVIDIDGSLVKNVYVDHDLVNDPNRLDAVLASIPLLPWVKPSGIIDMIDWAVFITGRQYRQRNLTKRWIRGVLGIRSFDLTMLAYQSKQQYLNDKENEISKVVDRWLKSNGDNARIIFIEDDPDIIEFLREIFTRPCITLVTVDSDGNPHWS